MAMIKKTIKYRKAYAIDDEIMYDDFFTCDFGYNDDEKYPLFYHAFRLLFSKNIIFHYKLYTKIGI